MNYQGKVYRPWMEADSFLFQVTPGCSHTRCTFCDMFRDKRFSIRDLGDILKDIDEARTYFRRLTSIFLIDGNVLALKTDFLLSQSGCQDCQQHGHSTPSRGARSRKI